MCFEDKACAPLDEPYPSSPIGTFKYAPNRPSLKVSSKLKTGLDVSLCVIVPLRKLVGPAAIHFSCSRPSINIPRPD